MNFEFLFNVVGFIWWCDLLRIDEYFLPGFILYIWWPYTVGFESHAGALDGIIKEFGWQDGTCELDMRSKVL